MLGVDHDKIILLPTPFPTIPMLVKNCCYTVIVFYVGNKRCCIVLYRIALYCIVIVIVIPANPNHSSIGGYCYQASHLHPVDPYIIPCSLPLLTVNNTLVTANQVLFVLLPFLQWCPFCPLYPSLIDHNQQISNSQSSLVCSFYFPQYCHMCIQPLERLIRDQSTYSPFLPVIR